VAQSCGRCGETFEEAVDGACPACGRKLAAGARRPAVQRVYSEDSGKSTWRLVALAVVAVLAFLGWLVYLKVTAAPPPPVVEAAKKKTTLKDWQAGVLPAKFIPALDALRVQASKADGAPLEDVVKDIRRVVQDASPLDARIMLLSALEGTSGKRAASLLTALAPRLPEPVTVEDADDLRSLRTLTARAALASVDDASPDARQAAAACLPALADPRELPAATSTALREACHRLAKDERAPTREAAAKALERLDPK
jgi:hypothetical protein